MPYPDHSVTSLAAPALKALGLDGRIKVALGGVTPIQTPAGRAWAKTVEPPRRNVNAMILPAIAMLLPLPILRRGVAGKGGNTLLRQGERLRALHDQGLPVALALYVDRNVLITADGGDTVDKMVRKPDYRAQNGMEDATLARILLTMTDALAELHRHGTAHGRPKIRDFAWDGEKVTILDLEERPWDVMPMADAQARDVFIWIHDLCGMPFSRTLAPDAAARLLQGMTPDMRDSLRRFLRLLRFAAPLARGMLRLLPGNRELVAGVGAYDVLRDAMERGGG